MASTDEASALKRNTVHQTRLSMELQQLEKDRGIRLREMQKASQVFARRHEQIQGIRERACLRRVTSAPVQPNKRKTDSTIDSSDNSTTQPFITRVIPVEETHLKRQLRKTATAPKTHGPFSSSGSLSTTLNVDESTGHRGVPQKCVGFVSPAEDSENRKSTSSRYRDDVMIVGAGNTPPPSSVSRSRSPCINRRGSVPCDTKHRIVK